VRPLVERHCRRSGFPEMTDTGRSVKSLLRNGLRGFDSDRGCRRCRLRVMNDSLSFL
jgi:hypothetical protein